MALRPSPPPTREEALASQSTPVPPKSPEPPNPVPDPVPEPPPDDIIPGFLTRNRIHLLGGSPHAGKTTLAAHIGRCLLKGEPILGLEALTPVKVPYFGMIFTDRPPRENLQWFALEGIGDCPYYSFLKQVGLDSVYDLAYKTPAPGFHLFRHCLDALKAPEGGVVFVDVFAPTFTGRSLFDANTVHRNMTLNQQLIETRKLTILASVYGAKQVTDTKQRYLRHEDRIIGAAPLRGCASSVLYLTTEPESGELGYQELTIVPRGANARIVVKVTRQENGLYRALSIDEEAEAVQSDEVGRALTLLACIDEADTTTATIVSNAMTMYGISRATINRYLAVLLDKGAIVRSKHGSYRKRPPD
jgi:hypothetical protein